MAAICYARGFLYIKIVRAKTCCTVFKNWHRVVDDKNAFFSLVLQRQKRNHTPPCACFSTHIRYYYILQLQSFFLIHVSYSILYILIPRPYSISIFCRYFSSLFNFLLPSLFLIPSQFPSSILIPHPYSISFFHPHSSTLFNFLLHPHSSSLFNFLLPPSFLNPLQFPSPSSFLIPI